MPPLGPPRGGAKGSKPGPACAKIPLGSRLARHKPENIEIFKNPRFSRRKWPAPGAPNLTQMKRKAAIGCIFVVCLSACFGCLRWPLGPTTKTFHDLPGTRAGHGGTPLRPPSRRREPRAGERDGRAVPALPCTGQHETARDGGNTRRHGTAQAGTA